METISMLFILAAYPALYLSIGRNAWRGLHGQTTMTHFGVRGGRIAQVYGVFYILFLIGITAMIPRIWGLLKDLTLPELVSAFKLRFPASPGYGLIFILMALVFFPFVWWVLNKAQARDPN